jgi:hypothetical protein
MNTVTALTEINHQEANIDPTKISDDTFASIGKVSTIEKRRISVVSWL